MGQSNARQRLHSIKENVDEITEKIKSDEMTDDDRNRSHDILIDYIKELKFILSKSLRTSNIRKVEKLIVAALQDLATLEGEIKTVEPRLKAKSMQALHEIERNMKSISENLTNPNLETEKETISTYKKRISLIEDYDQEVGATKTKVLDAVENVFTELEIEEKLKLAEEKHRKYKLDLNRFIGVSESNCYKKHKDHLVSLKEEVYQISEVSEKLNERKSYLLFNIDNNLAALEKRAKENEDKIQKQIDNEIFKAPPVITNVTLIGEVVSTYCKFEKSFSANCSLRELQDVFVQMNNLKIKIDQKLKVLENQIQIQDVDPFAELIPVKESEVVDGPVASPRIVNIIKEIQKDVMNLKEQISTMRYSKDSSTYNNFKKKLEDCQMELESLPLTDAEDCNFSNDVLKLTQNVLASLENNAKIDRRSTTGDILIDIMSMSSIVNELGNNIHNIKTKEEYEYTEKELRECLHTLTKLEIPTSRSNVRQFRDYMLIQIDSHLSNLEKIKRNSQKESKFKEPTPETSL